MPAGSFEEFVDSNFDVLAKFAGVITRDRDLAHDVLVDALIKAEARWSRIGKLKEPTGYVRAMIVSQACDHHRAGRRRARLAEEMIPAGVYSGPDAFSAVSDRDLLKTALDRLPERQRCAVVGRYYLGWSDAELAQMLSCSQSTVRTHLSRALASLRADANLSTKEV